MSCRFTSLALYFSIYLIILTVGAPSIVRAEIPFTQAKDMYRGTKDELKKYSPFWGMVALHGKMLEQIRFFGPYREETKTIQDPNRPDLPARIIKQDGVIDQNNQIAKLLIQLFPSPDGVQFVANSLRDDAVGNLSRDLPKINSIIEILLSDKRNPDKIKSITDLMPIPKGSSKNIAEKNSVFSKLLVNSYNNQTVYANPQKPEKQLYPENIVITALLTFFVKVADHKSQLKDLTFLMKNDFDDKSQFLKDEYFQIINQGQEHIDKILKDKQNPEPSFFISKGFTAYENPISEPVNYRSDTCYKTPEGFPDCGETSWRNVVTLFLSANKGGVVDQEAIDVLKTNLQKLNPGINLDTHERFQQMMRFFEDFPDISAAATKEAHTAWAQVASDLNEGEEPQSLNDVQYGREVSTSGIKQYEIKSAVHEQVKGIVSMFNVIAKLIPDQVLNEPWDVDQEKRFSQVAKKLDRLCALFSRNDMSLSWENDDSHDQTINNEFMTVTFSAYSAPVFKWHFIKGHFQLVPITSSENDWRFSYKSADENLFMNEWMASLYLKLDEEKFIEDETYGSKFPLSLIFNKDLGSILGAIKAISFILYRDKMHAVFLPLIDRWIQKSIPLTNESALDFISSLLLSANEQQVKIIFSNPKFNVIKEKMEMIKNNIRKNPLQFSVENSPSITTWVMLSKNFPEYRQLDLSSNSTFSDGELKYILNLSKLNLGKSSVITDDGLKNLVNLSSLSLSFNNKITDDGLKNLVNLSSLSLASNNKITDVGLKPLVNLTHLDLNNNEKITDKGLEYLVNLTSLSLAFNNKITDVGLKPLVNLTHLNLSLNSKITDKGLEPFMSLTRLDLRENRKITDVGLEPLVNLESLDLTDNNMITDKAINKLRTRNPNIKIIGR